MAKADRGSTAALIDPSAALAGWQAAVPQNQARPYRKPPMPLALAFLPTIILFTACLLPCCFFPVQPGVHQRGCGRGRSCDRPRGSHQAASSLAQWNLLCHDLHFVQLEPHLDGEPPQVLQQGQDTLPAFEYAALHTQQGAVAHPHQVPACPARGYLPEAGGHGPQACELSLPFLPSVCPSAALPARACCPSSLSTS